MRLKGIILSNLIVMGEVRHLDSSFGGFGALVAQATPGAVECLLLVVTRQNTEDDRHLLCGIQVGTTLGHTVADVIEVRCSATDDTSDDDNGVVASTAGHPCGAIGQFNSTRHVCYGDVLMGVTLAGKQVECSLEQGSGDVLIPFGTHDAHGQAFDMR